MTAENFEVCLLTSPVREVIQELRVLLLPLRGLNHHTLDCVEANYSDSQDALVLRLHFSKIVKNRNMQKRLVGHLGELGLDLIVKQELSLHERAKFEEMLSEDYGFRVQQYPTVRSGCVVPKILDILEEHIHNSLQVRRLTTEAEVEPSYPVRTITSDLFQLRASTSDSIDELISGIPPRPGTFGALDSMIAELPRLAERSSESIDIVITDELGTCEDLDSMIADLPERAETFGALDDMISALPNRKSTFDALDDIIEELRS